ncbi:23S rRNA (adenine(2503)-C(2))-methyltransferase RlmN, partial [Parabacteroides distasonis]
MDCTRKVLMGMTLDELKAEVKMLGMPAFTASQILKWLYTKHVSDIENMTDISKANRELLASRFVVGGMPPLDCQRSVDGTVKYLF